MSRRAFTLMEIMIVLAIIGLVFAGSYRGITALNEQAALQKPFEDLRSMAKTAWQRSMLSQRSWQIHFFADYFVLEPKQAANADDQRMYNDSDKQKGLGSGPPAVHVAPGISMEIRRWGRPESEWITMQKKTEVTWIFEPSGLLEPISVRFTSDRGTVGAKFDPLTASVKEDITDRD